MYKRQIWDKFIVKSPLLGNYQKHNIRGVIAWASQMHILEIIPLEISKLKSGIENVLINTQLKGRFQTISAQNPEIIVDTAHNEAGIQCVLDQISNNNNRDLTIIIGMVKDKDVKKVLHVLPNNAYYIFTEISNPRKLDKFELEELAMETGKKGITLDDVNIAVDFVKKNRTDHQVLIIGSTYLIAEINEL